ncbi:MAG TPA: radical SAM protein [Candidatus Aerophobetes bacterium]|uniref:Radical SAM protein n=1 Tax=Aerophobetes bacterium TaxID=2030807 RepID=A0A7V0MYT7_UNCAE|nr:radical SAM protein [Candidatus Aerophobetes bacterium]
MNRNNTNYPGFIKLYKTGKLARRVKDIYQLMKNCQLCPRRCGVNRLKGELGYCRAGIEPEVSSFHSHFGEEPPISGWSGSGTVFFTHCNLRCVFCQNYPISQLGYGNKISIEQLASIMLNLQKRGCHNINLVTPTHFTPQIVAALNIAAGKGLTIPLVYNCGGYESIQTLKLLEGIVDIYMPDIKYGGKKEAEKYSNAPDYFEVAKMAVKEMHRQVGDLQISPDGIAKRGLLIRHLILPNNLARSERILKFIKDEVSPNSYISIMSQYFPAYKAVQIPELNRKITKKEYQKVIGLAQKLSLEKGWRQELTEEA